jgi:hypothetical protein
MNKSWKRYCVSHGNLSFLIDNSLRSCFRIYNGWHCLCDFQIQANKILRKRIAEDQFLDLVSVETEVRSVYKELYR